MKASVLLNDVLRNVVDVTSSPSADISTRVTLSSVCFRWWKVITYLDRNKRRQQLVRRRTVRINKLE